MKKNEQYKLEEVLPIRFGFLKALPMLLWPFIVAVLWILLLRVPHKPLDVGTIASFLWGTIFASFVAYFVVYGLIGSLLFHPDTVGFGDRYIKRNIWSYNVWVFQPVGKEMQFVVLSRSVSVGDFLCRYFSSQAPYGYVLRYATGGWFRGRAEFWFIDNHVPRPRDISVRRDGRANDNYIRQKLRLCDREGSVIYWRVCDLFEHVSVRGSDGFDFAEELNWLLRRYVENDSKRLTVVK